MRVALFANPRSGSGRALQQAQAVTAHLQSAGITVKRHDIGPGLPPVDPITALAAAPGPRAAPPAAMIVAGGDGTVRSLAAAAIATGVPLYHLPSGNENLFAREFAMTARPERVLAALFRGKVTAIDAGEARWRGSDTPIPFYLMASIGPDAGVCHRLDATRTKAVGHRAYTGPIAHEFVEPAIHRLQVSADGRKVIDARGMLVVANCRQYAMRIDPCPQADPTDGRLDLAFIPGETATDILNTLIRLRLRHPPPELIRASGHTIQITLPPKAMLQVDGEAASMPPLEKAQESTILTLTTRQGVFPVLDAR